jgi:ArsR family transcriptional regulator
MNGTLTERTDHLMLRAQVRLLRTLSHPGRLALLAALGQGEACVCHLRAALRRSQPYVSQQLAVLRTAGLLKSRKAGTFTYYRLRDPSVLGLLDHLDRLAGKPGVTRLRAPEASGCDCPSCRPRGAGGNHVH